MRTFVAVELDRAVRERVGALAGKLQIRCPKLSWVRPRNMHLTIKFLGEIEPAQVGPIQTALDQAARQCRMFEISFTGLGVFPPHGPVKVLWLGVDDATGVLAKCWNCCEEALEAIGFAREERPFSAHLTLARNKNPRLSDEVRKMLHHPPPFAALRQRVTGLTFYQSTLTGDGPVYESISKHELNGD